LERWVWTASLASGLSVPARGEIDFPSIGEFVAFYRGRRLARCLLKHRPASVARWTKKEYPTAF